MAYAFVQQSEGSGSGSPKTAAITPTAGNMLFAVVASDNTGATYGCSDGTNTWTACGVFDGSSIGAGIGLGLFYAKNVAGSAVTVSGSHTGGSITGVYVAEYSGLDTSAPFIASAANPQNGPGSSTDAVTSGNANATSQPAVAIGFYFNSLGQNANVEAAGTGYTGRTAVWAAIGSAGLVACARAEDKRVTATGNVAATFTANVADGGDVFLTAIALFKEAAGGTSIAPTVGSLALGGVAPAVTKPTVTAPAALVGSLTLAGVASTVTKPTVTLPNPAVGALALTGVVVTQTLTVPAIGTCSLTFAGAAPVMPRVPAVGNITFSVVAATLGFGIAPSAGTLAASAAAPSLSLGLTGLAGALTLSGQTVAVAQNSVRNTVVGSLALSGSAVTLGVRQAPLVGTLSLGGLSASLALTLQGSAGALSIGGQPALLGSPLIPSAGALALSGAGPAWALSNIVGSGALSLSAASATLRLTINTGAGVISLAGAAPVLAGLSLLTPASGGLTIGSASGALASGMAPGAGLIAFGGQFAVVSQLTLLTPSAGGLSLTGVAPLFGRISIAPDAAALVLAGQAAPASSLSIMPLGGQITSRSTAPPVTPGYTAQGLYLRPLPAPIPTMKAGVY